MVMFLSGVMSNSIVCNTVFAGGLSSNKNKNMDFTRFNTVLDDDNAVSKFKFLKVCPEEKFGKDLSGQKAKKENSFNISNNNNNDVKIKDKNKISKFGTKLGIGLSSSVVASGTIAAIALKVKDSGVKQREISVTPVEPYEEDKSEPSKVDDNINEEKEGNTKKNYGVVKILIGVFIPAIIISLVSTLIFNSKGQESIEINSKNIDSAKDIIRENLRSEEPIRVIFNIGCDTNIYASKVAKGLKALAEEGLLNFGDQVKYSLNMEDKEGSSCVVAPFLGEVDSCMKGGNIGTWIKEDETTFIFLDLASFADKIEKLLKDNEIDCLEKLKGLSKKINLDGFYGRGSELSAVLEPLGTVICMSWTRNNEKSLDNFLNYLESKKELKSNDYIARRVSVAKLYKKVLESKFYVVPNEVQGFSYGDPDPHLKEVINMLNTLKEICRDKDEFKKDPYMDLLKEFYYYVLLNPDRMSNKVDNNKVFKCLKELDKKDSNYETFRSSLEELLNNLSEDGKVLIDNNSANNN